MECVDSYVIGGDELMKIQYKSTLAILLLFSVLIVEITLRILEVPMYGLKSMVYFLTFFISLLGSLFNLSFGLLFWY